MSNPEFLILNDATFANQDKVTEAISSMTENNQITLSGALLKQLMEGNCNIANVNVVSKKTTASGRQCLR